MAGTSDKRTVVAEIQAILAKASPGQGEFLAALDCALTHFDCVVGTIHGLNRETGMLELLADRGIPEAIRGSVRVIPIGKGMAGIAAERLEPVQVCNLQTDESGVAKPSARLTAMKGSIALPMLVNGELRGTFGVGKPSEYEFSADEADELMKIGTAIGEHLP
jgi:signal transduction protein with GAF and PtsI domain